MLKIKMNVSFSVTVAVSEAFDGEKANDRAEMLAKHALRAAVEKVVNREREDEGLTYFGGLKVEEPDHYLA